ncbi:MAG: hypothetical protein V5A30_02585 [Haloarculaceae archaeon]
MADQATPQESRDSVAEDGADSPSQLTDNFAAFALFVGAVSIAFGAVFQLVFDGIIALILNGFVLGVGLISLVIGLSLDAIGGFDAQSTEVDEPDDSVAVRSRNDGDNLPLPPVLNFDAELERIEEHYNGSPQEEFVQFREEYERLKSSPSSRSTIASDLRAMANPLSVLAKGEAIEPEVERISDGLFQYIEGSASDFLSVVEWSLYDEDGNECTVTERQSTKARFKARAENRGDKVKTEIFLRFRNTDEVVIKEAYLPVGLIREGETKELDTQVYVPSLAVTADVYALAAADNKRVLDL